MNLYFIQHDQFYFHYCLCCVLQILLLRQRRDKDELKCDSDTACVLIWHRVITTLTKSITNPPAPEAETEGLASSLRAQLSGCQSHSLNCFVRK